MAVIAVRTTAEAREYMVLQLSECGDRLVLEPVESYMDGERWVHSYLAGCAEQGVQREFEFTVEPGPAGADEGLFGPGPEPSRVIDAGEWYLVSSRYLLAAKAADTRFAEDPSLQLVEEVYEYLSRASAAMLEVLRFIPTGEAAPPDSAFWTQRGRSVREEVGDQLARSVLEPARAQAAGAMQTLRDKYQPEQ